MAQRLHLLSRMGIFYSRISWFVTVFLILLNACSSSPQSFNKKPLTGEQVTQSTLEESPENVPERGNPIDGDHNPDGLSGEEAPGTTLFLPNPLPVPGQLLPDNKIPGRSPFDIPQGDSNRAESTFNQAFGRTELSRQIIFYEPFENLNSNFNASNSFFKNISPGVSGKAVLIEDLSDAGLGPLTLSAEGNEIHVFTPAQKNEAQYLRECQALRINPQANALAFYENSPEIFVDLQDTSILQLSSKVRGKGSVYGAAIKIKFYDAQDREIPVTKHTANLGNKVDLESCNGDFQAFQASINLQAFFDRRKNEGEARIPAKASVVFGLNLYDGGMIQTKDFKIAQNEGAAVFEDHVTATVPFSLDFFFKSDPFRLPLPGNSELASFQLGENKFQIKIEGAHLVVTGQNGAFRLSHPITLDPYYWNQVGLTVSAQEAHLFINGEEVAHQAGAFGAQELSRWSWGRSGNETAGFPGMLDEFRVYQGALQNFCRSCAVDETGILPIAQEAYQIQGPQYQPLDEKIAKAFKIKAAPNEYEAATFALYSEKNWPNVKLNVSDLRGPGVISSQNIDVRVIGFWKQLTQSKINNVTFEGSPRGSFTKLVPELLLYDERDVQNLIGQTRFEPWPDNPEKKRVVFPVMQGKEHFRVDLSPFKRAQFIASVHIPANLPPGTYTGSIDVMQNQQNLKRIPFQVEVLNIHLPDTQDIPQIFSLYYKSNFTGSVDRVSPERFRMEVEDIRKHGTNMFAVDLMDNSGVNYNPDDPNLGYNQAIQLAQNLHFRYLLFSRCERNGFPSVNWGPYDKAKRIFQDVFCYAQDEPDNPSHIQGEISHVARIHNKWTMPDERNFSNIQNRNALQNLLHRLPENEQPKAASAIQKEYQLRMSNPQSPYLNGIPENHCARKNANNQFEYYSGGTLFDCPAFTSYQGLMDRLGNPTWRELGISEVKLDLSILSMFWKNPITRFDGVSQRNVMVDYVKALLQNQDRTRSNVNKEIIYYSPAYDEEMPISRIYNGVFPWLSRLNGTIPYAYYHPDYRGCKADMNQEGEFDRCRALFQQNPDNMGELTSDPYNDFDQIASGRPEEFSANPDNSLLFLIKDQFLVYPADILNPHGERVPVSIPTLNWESFREGIDDYRYFLAFCKKLKPQLDYGECPYDAEVQRALAPLLDPYKQAWMAELNNPTNQDTPYRGKNIKAMVPTLPELRKQLIQMILQ